MLWVFCAFVFFPTAVCIFEFILFSPIPVSEIGHPCSSGLQIPALVGIDGYQMQFVGSNQCWNFTTRPVDAYGPEGAAQR